MLKEKFQNRVNRLQKLISLDAPQIILENEVRMFNEAYNQYVDTLEKGGTLLLDSDLIPKQKENIDIQVFEIPATKIAEELGNAIVANVVMLGAFTSIINLVEVVLFLS